MLASHVIGLLPDMLTDSWFRWVTKDSKYNAFSIFFKTLSYAQNMSELLVMYCFPMKQSEHFIIQKENQRCQGQPSSSSNYVVTQLRRCQTTWLDDLYGCIFFISFFFVWHTTEVS